MPQFRWTSLAATVVLSWKHFRSRWIKTLKAFRATVKYKRSFIKASVHIVCSIGQPKRFRSRSQSQQASYIASSCLCSFSPRSFPVCCRMMRREIPCVKEIGRCVHIVCLCAGLNNALLVCRVALTDGKAEATFVQRRGLTKEAANSLSLSTVHVAIPVPVAHAILL